MPTSAFSIHPAAFALGMISNGMTIFSVLHLFLIPALLAALAAENCHYKLAASPPIPSEATTFHFWGPLGQHNIRARRPVASNRKKIPELAHIHSEERF